MKKSLDIKKGGAKSQCGTDDVQVTRTASACCGTEKNVRVASRCSEEAAGVAGLEPGMKVALYARVSTQMQEREATVASQISELLLEAARHGAAIAGDHHFVDEGYSGSTLERPALDALRDKVAEGVFDVVLVYDPDRLARNYLYQMLLVEEFERHACRLHFVRCPIGRTPDEQLLLQMQGVIAESERAKIRERTRRGKLHRMRNGELVTGRRTFGYRYFSKQGDVPARLEVIEAEAAVIRNIFDWFVDGQTSIRQIAVRLNAECAVKPLKSERWTASVVHYILHNNMYYGVGYANRVEAVLPAAGRPLQPVYRKYPKTGKRERAREEWFSFNCAPIISEETYLLAQDHLASNRALSSRNARNDHLLRGLIVCGECGKRFKASGRVGRYLCTQTQPSVAAERGKPCCGNLMRPRITELDQAVWQEIVGLIKRPSTLRKYHRLLHGKIMPKACPDNDLAIRKKRLEERIHRINNLYVAGDLDRAGHAEKMKAVKEELHGIASRIDKFKEQNLEEAEVEQMLKSFSTFSSSIKKEIDAVDFTTRRHIVENMVKDIIIKNNAITIEYAAPLKKNTLCPTTRW